MQNFRLPETGSPLMQSCRLPETGLLLMQSFRLPETGLLLTLYWSVPVRWHRMQSGLPETDLQTHYLLMQNSHLPEVDLPHAHC